MAALYPEVMESEMSDYSPTAPRKSQHTPLVSSRSGSPPRYDAVLAQDPQARETAAQVRRGGGRGFTESMARAAAVSGASLGRFFGIHDEQLRGWNRGGNRNQLYTAMGEEESIPSHYTPPTSPPSASMQRRNGRVGRIANRVRNTIRRRRPPTTEEVKKSLPTFWPVMTITIAVIEVALLIATITTGGLAPIKLTPDSTTGSVVGFDNITEIGLKETVPNFFIGTSKSSLIHTGAMYTPCMRENINFQIQAAKDRLEENNLRCCLSSALEQCGMLPQQTCTEVYEGQVLGGASRCRAEMENMSLCTGGVTLHPCCMGILGECVVTTSSNCSFYGGEWHPERVLCSEIGTGCFNHTCEFSWIGKTIGQIPSQGLRFFSAIFLYDGVVTLVIIGLFKLYTSWPIEKRIGWLRVICIYTISGIGGFLLSGIFDPTSVSVGGTGGLSGLIGVQLVELLQGWKYVRKPCVELFKTILLMVGLLVLGTLPYIDNFTQIGGFIFGALASFIFVPYISIGKWDRVKKLCLLSIAIPIILALFLFGFMVFYNLQHPNFCPYCSYINCIPYTNTFCDDFITNLLPFIPTTT